MFLLEYIRSTIEKKNKFLCIYVFAISVFLYNIQIKNKQFSHLRVNAQGLGLKRSVTTLRGGTLGYAEIVALKVTKPSTKPRLVYGSDILVTIFLRRCIMRCFRCSVLLLIHVFCTAIWLHIYLYWKKRKKE